MGEVTKIEWADATLNFWWGCEKVSPGCKNCYAENLATRFGKDIWGPGKEREEHLDSSRRLALKLNRQAQREGRRIRVFSASMSDWLDSAVPIQWVTRLLTMVSETPALTWMLLTKRPHLWQERMELVVKDDGPLPDDPAFHSADMLASHWLDGKPPSNVWVGSTMEDQQRYDERIAHLLDIPAQVRFMSCEPLLEVIDFDLTGGKDSTWDDNEQGVGWVICGGESGPGARPMHPSWARALRDQCGEAGIPFHFKQWGDWRQATEDEEPDCYLAEDGSTYEKATKNDGHAKLWIPMVRPGKKETGRVLDGRTWDELPASAWDLP